MTSHVVFEQNLQNLYQKILNLGDVVLDIGAHSGRHTLPMTLAISGKFPRKVFAYELIPECKQWILHRFRVSGVPIDNLEICPYSLSDYSGHSEFILATDRPEESGLIERNYNGVTKLHKIFVQVRKLDEVFLGGRAEFIKIDCEGAEYSVLKGGISTIARCRP